MDIGYRIIDGVDALGTQMSDTVFGAPIRLGVTGLAHIRLDQSVEFLLGDRI